MVDVPKIKPLAQRLSKNLSSRRKELGLTQAQVAEIVKVETESISRFERGVTLPSLAKLELLAVSLDTTIADLLAECPGSAYGPDERIGALLAPLRQEVREDLIAVFEQMCRMLQRAQLEIGSATATLAVAETTTTSENQEQDSGEEDVSQLETRGEDASESHSDGESSVSNP